MPAKEEKPRAIPVAKPAAPSSRWMMHSLIVTCLLAAMTVGLKHLNDAVDHKYLTASEPPAVVLLNRPAWMKDSLADQIEKLVAPTTPVSPLDDSILEQGAAALAKNPWVKQVNQLRRTYRQSPGDTIEVDCTYRTPAALVSWQQGTVTNYYLVATDYCLLPETYPLRDAPSAIFAAAAPRTGVKRPLNLRVIEGIKNPPPAVNGALAVGQPWPGDDLAAGVDVAAALLDCPTLDDVWCINVSNVGDSSKSQITLFTQFGSKIYWGEPIQSKFHAEVPPATKLARLNDHVLKTGRADAKPSDCNLADGDWYLDLRFDAERCPKYPANASAN